MKKEKKAQKRAVIYARYSSDNQREESIEGQIRVCTAYAQTRGYALIETYCDRARSGRTDQRENFQKLLADAKTGAFDVVLCWKYDRFSRNRYDSAVYKSVLRRAGVQLESATEPIPEGPEGIILESMLEGMAEYYSANLAENVRRGMKENALKRRTNGVRVFGLRSAPDGTYEHDPDTAPIVSRIFSEYGGGRAAVDICRDLNAEGFRTINGKRFDKNSIRRIITCEKYKGLYKFDDVVDPEGIPPIVSLDVWENAQKMLKAHHAAPNRKKDGPFLLSGKLFCGHCGAPMVGDCGDGRAKRYSYYTCVNRKAHTCDKARVPKEDAEDLIVQSLFEVASSDAILGFFADSFMKWQAEQEKTSEIETLRKRAKELDTAIEKAVDRLIEIDSPALRRRLEEMEAQRAEIDVGIAQELLKMPKRTREDVIFFLRKFRGGRIDDPEFRAYLVETFLAAAFLFDDGKLILQLNYSGDCNRVTLDVFQGLEGTSGGSTFATFGPPEKNPLLSVMAKEVSLNRQLYHRAIYWE